ncbi:3597_t:CDS:2, partial [Gigaspora margarita]
MRYHKLELLVFKPTYNPDNDTFECNKGIYYDETSHTTIISQISGFEVNNKYSWVVFDLEGLSFFTDIAYLVLSSILLISYIIPQKDRQRFVLKRIFFLVIFISIVECFFEYALYCTPRNVDTIFFFILTTVLTRSISSFFSNNREVKVKDIKKYGKLAKNTSLDMYKIVFLHINDYKKVSNVLDHQRLYLEIEKNNEEALKYARKVKAFYVDREYEKIIHFYREQINKRRFLTAKKGEVFEKDLSIVEKIILEKFQRPIGKRVLKEKVEKFEKNKHNIPGTKIIAEKLVMHARVYANILEMGLFQYITYSHRSRKEVNMPEYITGINNDEIKIEMKDTEVVWIVIPELMESYAYEKDYHNKLNTEINYCEEIEKMLNSEPDEE